MLDLKLVRERTDSVRANLERRQDSGKLRLFDELVKDDKRLRELKVQVEALRSERNRLTQEVSQLKKEGQEASRVIAEASRVSEKIKSSELELVALEERVKASLFRVPNLMHESVPYGKDDSENVEVRVWGTPRSFDFELKPHGEFLETAGMANFSKASEVSGAGFNYLLGGVAMLERALEQFALETLQGKGFTPVLPPVMLHRKPYEGVVDLGDFENVMYKIENEDLYLIATSEHSMAALYSNEVIPEEQLPVKLVGVSPCFRKEIGSKNV
ncbi:MAG TPA: aminoacyl--tRNA ligase-related protein, partial [archaeon]|nr:aminoacyl--tRNA ligase-related protein [archaeon]